MKNFRINVCVWIDLVSLDCMSLTPRYLSWHVDDLVGLCSHVGVVPSGVPANFISKWEKFKLRSWIHVCFQVEVWPINGVVTLRLWEEEIPLQHSWASEWEKFQQRSVDLVWLRVGKIPVAEWWCAYKHAMMLLELNVTCNIIRKRKA